MKKPRILKFPPIKNWGNLEPYEQFYKKYLAHIEGVTKAFYLAKETERIDLGREITLFILHQLVEDGELKPKAVQAFKNLNIPIGVAEWLVHRLENSVCGESQMLAFQDKNPTGRPTNYARDQQIYREVSVRIAGGISILQAVADIADALADGDISGVRDTVLSPAAVRTIYYAQKKRVEDNQRIVQNHTEFASMSYGQKKQIAKDLIEAFKSDDPEVIREATLCYAAIKKHELSRVLCNPVIEFILSYANINPDLLRHDFHLLNRMLAGATPNEAFGWGSETD